jgi:tetratricopeptide (TPR) repeat protein
MKKIITVILVFFVGLNFFAQTTDDKIKAREIAIEAIRVMDNGEIDKSITMLQESQKLDAKTFNYPYEIGYAYYLKGDFKNAINTLKKVIKYEENNDQCFTLLGNIYDIDKQPEKAIEIYNKGLEKFPNSGRLYYEKGNVQEVLKEYDNALESWGKGISVAPSYPSNYHTASIYYAKYTTEKIWGILYGELFMNIERGSQKTEEISKLLYDTYKASITIKSKTESEVSFSQKMQLTLPNEDEKLKIPFSMPYELTMILALTSEMEEKELSIKSLNKIRTNFIAGWYENKRNIEYPNIVFEWHKKLLDLGYFEAYNYWLLMKGNEEEFIAWSDENQEKWDEFIGWFSPNPLIVDEQNNFHRLQNQ